MTANTDRRELVLVDYTGRKETVPETQMGRSAAA
jgi:hypothetical protein